MGKIQFSSGEFGRHHTDNLNTDEMNRAPWTMKIKDVTRSKNLSVIKIYFEPGLSVDVGIA